MPRCSNHVVRLLLALGLLAAALAPPGQAQEPTPIYDEAKVPDYTLPPLLTGANGDSVRTAEAWWTARRPRLLRQFRTHVYGDLPPLPPAFRVETHEAASTALDGAATRRQVTLHFTDGPDGPQLDLLVYVPTDADGPVPVFAGLNFAGNHTVAAAPEIRLPDGWVPDWGDVPADSGRAVAAARGARERRWPVERIVGRGYGLITAYYGDLFPDRAGGLAESVYQLAPDAAHLAPGGGDWSALSAWAWGLHRMVDYAARAGAIDDDRVMAVGHSRLGKAALWAGATDRRLAAVFDNASGAGGSALFRRRYGERAVHLDTSFPHWFCDAFSRYRENEAALPVDQHQLLAMIAPRPLLVSPKSEDRWADPRGMFLSARHAAPAWRLLGREGRAAGAMPPPDTPVLSRVGFFLRPGEHDLRAADWAVFLDFADRHLGPPSSRSSPAAGPH
jgi:hypothetical protein